MNMEITYNLDKVVLSFKNVFHDYDGKRYCLCRGGWKFERYFLPPHANEILTHDFLKKYPKVSFGALLNLAAYAKNDYDFGQKERTKFGSFVCKVICEKIHNEYELDLDEIKKLLPVMTSAYNGCEMYSSSYIVYGKYCFKYGEDNIATKNLYCSLFSSSVSQYLNKKRSIIYYNDALMFCRKYLNCCNNIVDSQFVKAVMRGFINIKGLSNDIYNIFDEEGFDIDFWFSKYGFSLRTIYNIPTTSYNYVDDYDYFDNDYKPPSASYTAYKQSVFDVEREKMINQEVCKNCMLYRNDSCFGKKNICEDFKYAPTYLNYNF